ncbi:MAG: ribokinase [Chloroflexi bacterium]|nr:ribokinase [Chloroflexota bacterium]
MPTKPRITVIGSLNMDMVVQAPRIPEPGETVLGDDFNTYFGGKGSNQAVAAARMGGTVTMIGRVGEDEFGPRLLKNLQDNSVNTDYMIIDAEAPSGVATITVDRIGQNIIVVASGANFRLTEADIDAAQEVIKDYWVVLQLETPIETVMHAANLAKDIAAGVILNPAPSRPLQESLLESVAVLVPNEPEMGLLTGMPVATMSQMEKAARGLLKRGPGAVVVTLGSRGALVVEEDQPGVHLQPHAVRSIDATGAGDAFVGALAVGLAEGLSLVEAAKLANGTAALSVKVPGAQRAMPTRTDVERFIADQQAIEQEQAE